ncbi:MAG: sulfotransferase domain-containing protein [Anaerolineae bacterium]|nr:sulfotransferase domain-containing protein [Anaerolineae bacterium]
MATTLHPGHQRKPLIEVLREGSYPFRVATGPIKYYVKARLGRGTYDAGLWESLVRTVETAQHCYPRRNDVIWATVQRAGHNWVSLVYTLVAEQLFHRREVDMEDIARYRAGFYRHIPIRYDLGDDETRFHYELPVPRLMHTHDPHYPWLDHRKILLQVRNPSDVLISKYYHGDFYPQTAFSDYLQTPTVRGLLNFYNSWGAALAAKRLQKVHVLHYEQMRSAPIETLQALFAFLDFPDVPVAYIEEAIEKTTPENLQRLEKQGKSLGDDKLASNVKSTRPEGGLPEADRAALRELVRQQVRYSFGYQEQEQVVVS